MKKLLISLLAITTISTVFLSGCKNDDNTIEDSSSLSVSDSAAVSDSETVTESKAVTDKTDSEDKKSDSSVADSLSSEKKDLTEDESFVDYEASNLVNSSTIKDNVFTYGDRISFEVPENFEIDRMNKCVSCQIHDDCKSKITFFDSTQSMKIENEMTYDKISEDFVKKMYDASIQQAENYGVDTENDNGGVRNFEKYEINGYKAVKYTIELNLSKRNTVITSVLVYVDNKLYSIGFTDYDGLHADEFNKCVQTIAVK